MALGTLRGASAGAGEGAQANLLEFVTRKQGKESVLFHPMFRSLSLVDRDAVVSRLRTLHVRRDQVLLNAGQECADLFIVVAGKFRVETASAGAAVALTSFLQPNDIYLERLSSPRYEASNTLKAALDSVVQTLPLTILQSAILASPPVGLEVLQNCVEAAVKLRRQLRRLKVEPVPTRVALAVYDVAQTQADGLRVLDRQITQSDLAAYTGLSREAVNRGLKKLSQADLLRKSDRGLEVNPQLAATNFLPLP